MREGRTAAWALAAAIAAGGAFGGCGEEDGAALGPDGGTDTGTGDEWESPVDGSVWDTESDDELDTEVPCDCSDPLCGIEYTCETGVKECECGTVCDDGYYGAIGWAPYLTSYKCYAPCGDGVACTREGDACTELDDGEALCLPEITAVSDGFDVKVVPEAQAWSIADAAQVDVELLVAGETRHLIMAFAAGGTDAVTLAIMESGVGAYYYLYVTIWLDGWAPGTLALAEGGEAPDGGVVEPSSEFTATLYRISESGDFWMVGDATSGSIELLETPEIAACNGPGCPKAVFGSMQMAFVGLEAEMEE
jgi:hypothetical protein